jgi:ubiquinone/menaquinone biosynthesis C-methylase UbiE
MSRSLSSLSITTVERRTTQIPDYENYDYLQEWKGRDIEDQAEKELLARLLGDRFSRFSRSCLDLGGGFGRLAPTLQKSFESVCLVDYSLRNLNIASGMTEASLVRSDIRSLPFEECSFECVVAIRVLHHVKDISSLMNEIVRVGKDGGYVILGIPNLRFGRYKGIRGNESVRIAPSQNVVHAHPNSVYRHESLHLEARNGLGLFDNKLGRLLNRIWTLSKVDILTSFLWWAKPENFICFRIRKKCKRGNYFRCDSCNSVYEDSCYKPRLGRAREERNRPVQKNAITNGGGQR